MFESRDHDASQIASHPFCRIHHRSNIVELVGRKVHIVFLRRAVGSSRGPGLSTVVGTISNQYFATPRFCARNHVADGRGIVTVFREDGPFRMADLVSEGLSK